MRTMEKSQINIQNEAIWIMNENDDYDTKPADATSWYTGYNVDIK